MKTKLNYLEGVRGLAALVVVFKHLQLAFAETILDDFSIFLNSQTDSWIASRIIHGSVNVFFNGELAVFIFWFLSAYVISIRLFELEGKNYLAQAFSKRYIRLVIPVIASVIFAYLLLAFGLMYNTELASLTDAKPNIWITTQYNFSQDLFTALKFGLWDTFLATDGEESYNPVLWTINPEWYGSMICFTLYAIYGSNKFRYVFYFVFAACAFFLSKFWIVTFILGHTMCDLHLSRNMTLLHRTFLLCFSNRRVNIATFIILVILGGFYNYYGSFYVLVSALLVVIIIRTDTLHRVFQHKYLIWLGKVSFGLYLLHFPIICSFSCYLYLTLELDAVSKVLVVSLLTIVLSLFCSHFFAKYIDRASIKLANKVGALAAGK